jgi:hypothetical protein
MAQLPNTDWLVQSAGTQIFIVHRYTEEELIKVDATDMNAVAQAQKIIHYLPELSAEDKCFAHFWFGYFYANLGRGE